LDGVSVNEGEFIGLVDGRLCTAGPKLAGVLTAVLAAMAMEERELLSLYYGQDISEAEAGELAEQIEAQYEDIEIELLPGGQPYYRSIRGAAYPPPWPAPWQGEGIWLPLPCRERAGVRVA